MNIVFNDPILDNNSDIRKKILEMIDSAKKEILIAMYYFTDEDILSKLQRKSENGCVVKIAYSNEDSELDILENFPYSNENFNIKKITFNDGLMHHKMMLVDRKYLMLGSYNFTYSAHNYNYESVIFLDNKNNQYKDIITRFLIHFQNLFGEDLNIDTKIIIEQEPNIFPCIKVATNKIKIIKKERKYNLIYIVKGISLYFEWKIHNAYFLEILVNNQSINAKFDTDNGKVSFVYTPENDADLEIVITTFDGEIISYKYTIIVNSINELFISTNSSNGIDSFIKDYRIKLNNLHTLVHSSINKITEEFLMNRKKEKNKNLNSIVKSNIDWFMVMG